MVALLSLMTSVAHAQQTSVSVQVLDSISGLAVPGASVAALNRSGIALSRSLSGADGVAMLRPGEVFSTVRVLKIGFRPRTVNLGASPAGRTVVLISQLPAQLSTVITRATGSNCPSDAAAQLGALLWDQARAGFDAVLAARAANPARVRLLRFSRTIAVHGGQIQQQSVVHIDTTSEATFFAARSAAAFEQRGFVDDNSTGRVYYAPDADELMDTTFTESHCFAAVASDDSHPRMRGIAFRPARAVDGRADITGTMWLDSASLVPRKLEFRYTDLEPAVTNAGAGGTISFRQSAGGIVFIDHWLLRAITPGEISRDPVGRMAPGESVPRRRRFDATVVSIHDIGGEVARARWPDGSTWRAVLGTLKGRVARERTGAAVPGAHVWLANTDYDAMTDSAGLFEIDELLPGPYDAVAADSTFGPFRVAQLEPKQVEAHRDSVVATALSLWDADRTFDHLCGRQPHEAGSVAVLGIVLEPYQASSKASVKAVWPANGDTGAPGVPGGVSSGSTSSDGRFTLCGIPEDTRVLFRYSLEGQPPADTVVKFASGHPLAALILPARTGQARTRPR